MTSINVCFNISDSEPLLGWIISEGSPAANIKDFYKASEVDNSLTVTNIGSASNPVYSYTKNFTWSSTDYPDGWYSKYGSPIYFYPVNRAGMVNSKPIVISFAESKVPGLKIGTSLEFSSDIGKYPATGTPTDLYIKDTSKVIFQTRNDPVKCRILFGDSANGSGPDGLFGTADDDSELFTLSDYLNSSTGKYEIPLAGASSTSKLRSITGATLKLVLYTSQNEDCDPILIRVKTGSGSNATYTNNWSYDFTAPVITIASISSDSTTAAVSYNGVDYLLGDNAIIAFSTSATDIAKYEWKVGNASWTIIPSSNFANGVCTFQAPASETAYSFRATDKAGNVSEVVTRTLKKDTATPTGSLSYSIKLNGSAAQSGFADEQADPSDTTSRLITYAPTLANQIYFDFSNISDAGSGIKRFNVKTGTSNNYITPAPAPNKTEYTLNLGSNWNENVYEIIVEDNVGHTKTLNTFKFTADSSAPSITIDSLISQGQSSTYPAVQIGDIWYLNRNKAKITFASTASDIDHYEWDQGKGNNEENYKTIDLTSGAYTVSNVPETTAIYYFRAVDKVGNKGTALAVKLAYDSAGPYVEDTNPVTYIAMNNSTSATTGFASSGTGTVTFTYNPSYVNKLIFDFSGVKDACSGIKQIVYKVNNTSNPISLDANSKGEISLAGPLNATYELVAIDNVNRETSLGTYAFTPDTTPPSVKEKDGSTTYWVLNDDVKKLQKYSIVGNTSLITVKDSQIGEDYLSNCYTGTLQISYPTSVISGAVKYKYIITPAQTSNEEGHRGYVSDKPNAGDSGWEDLTTSNGSYVFTIPDVTVPHTHIGVFFKDAVENVSEVYYFGNKDDYKYQWWLVENTITAANITITPSSEFSNPVTDYTLTVVLPQGTILHKVEATNASIESVSFSSYTQGNFSWNGSDTGNTTGYVYIPTMTVTLKDVNSQDAKLKINGVEKYIFGNRAFGNLAPFIDRIQAIDRVQTVTADTVKVPAAAVSALSGITASGRTMTEKASEMIIPGIEKKADKLQKKLEKAEKKLEKTEKKVEKAAPVIENEIKVEELLVPVEEIEVNAAPLSQTAIAPVAAKVNLDFEIAPESPEALPESSPSMLIIMLAICTLCSAIAGLVLCLKKKR